MILTQQKTSIRLIGGSYYLCIPPAVMEYAGFKEGKEAAIVEDKVGKKGNFIAVWSSDSDAKQ